MRSFINLIVSFGKKVNEDQVGAFSAQAAFFIIVSFFPFAMFLLTLLQYLPISPEALRIFLLGIFPEAMKEYITPVIEELFSAGSGTLLSITVIIALWSASKGILSVVRGLNSVYNIKETRNYVTVRLLSMLYTVIFAVLLLLMLAVFVFGNQLTIWFIKQFPSIKQYALLVISIRTIVGLCVLVLFFLALYTFVPNRKSGLFRELPGAIISATGWVGFSLLYSFYIDNMSNMSATYGSLTAIVLCMLWLYSGMWITFIGAEINSILANPIVAASVRRLMRLRKKQKKK